MANIYALIYPFLWIFSFFHLHLYHKFYYIPISLSTWCCQSNIHHHFSLSSLTLLQLLHLLQSIKPLPSPDLSLIGIPHLLPSAIAFSILFLLCQSKGLWSPSLLLSHCLCPMPSLQQAYITFARSMGKPKCCNHNLFDFL